MADHEGACPAFVLAFAVRCWCGPLRPRRSRPTRRRSSTAAPGRAGEGRLKVKAGQTMTVLSPRTAAGSRSAFGAHRLRPAQQGRPARDDDEIAPQHAPAPVRRRSRHEARLRRRGWPRRSRRRRRDRRRRRCRRQDRRQADQEGTSDDDDKPAKKTTKKDDKTKAAAVADDDDKPAKKDDKEKTTRRRTTRRRPSPLPPRRRPTSPPSPTTMTTMTTRRRRRPRSRTPTRRRPQRPMTTKTSRSQQGRRRQGRRRDSADRPRRVEVTRSTTKPIPSSGVAFTAKPGDPLYLSTTSTGDEGQVDVRVVQGGRRRLRADVEARRRRRPAPVGPRVREIDVRRAPAHAHVSQSMGSTGGAATGPGQLQQRRPAVTLALGGGCTRPYGAKYCLGGELAYDLDKAFAGLPSTDATR